MARVRRRVPVEVVTVTLVALVALPLALSGQREAQQAADESVESVTQFADLRPDTPGRRVVAEHFDRQGFDLSRNPSGTYHIPGEPPAPMPAPPAGMSAAPATSPSEKSRYQTAACDSEVVSAAVVTSSKTFLNKSETWLITEYSVRPSRTIKGPADPAFAVAIDGGRVRVAGTLLSTLSAPLLEEGAVYFLFLRNIPRSDAYEQTFSALRVTLATDSIEGVEVASQNEFIDRLTEWTNMCEGRK